MANELFCLKWNNYTSNIITELDSLRTDGDLVDVTILCDGRKITAHKVILSACSSYFRTIFRVSFIQVFIFVSIRNVIQYHIHYIQSK